MKRNRPYTITRPWAVSLLALGLVIGGSGVYLHISNPDGNVYASSPAPKLTTPKSKEKVVTINQEINSIIAQYPSMQIGVVITDLPNNQTYEYGTTDSYIAASITKLITASLFLHKVELGDQTLNTNIGGHTAEYQLRQLIEISDNDAWHALNTVLGNQTLQAWAEEIGLQSYNAADNTIAPGDTTLLISKLYTGKILNSKHTGLLLSYMQNADTTQYIKNSVPNGIAVYHKAGWLADRVHDTAIIDDGKHPYALTIFSKVEGTYDAQVGQAMFRAITDVTARAFTSTQKS